MYPWWDNSLLIMRVGTASYFFFSNDRLVLLKIVFNIEVFYIFSKTVWMTAQAQMLKRSTPVFRLRSDIS